jgi:hypothetical protein
MSRIFRRKLEVPAITTIDSKNFDTTKDELVWSNCDDGVEAVAVYRTAAGREYLRLVNAWHDLIVQFRKSDWDRIEETLVEWTMSDWTFATIFDPERGCYATDMSWGSVNEDDGPAPWPARSSRWVGRWWTRRGVIANVSLRRVSDACFGVHRRLSREGQGRTRGHELETFLPRR